MTFRKILLGSAAVVLGIVAVTLYSSPTLNAAASLASKQQWPKAAHILALWLGGWRADSELRLGNRYFVGDDVPKDYGLAVYWYRRAAAKGRPEAEVQLGKAYVAGLGVPLDGAMAKDWFTKAANQGDADAMLNLGRLYERGLGVTGSETDALTWFRNAAEKGNATGQLLMGLAYFQGTGTTVDLSEAALWMRKAADQGEPDAELMLSSMYGSGDGVPQDLVQAVVWAQRAADQGNAGAQFELGAMYFNGTGVAQDKAKANVYFLKAATQGEPRAQETLGQIYNVGQYGEGQFASNKVIAYAFFNLSSAQGNKDAIREKEALSDSLTPEQIASGQAMTSRWKVNDPLPFPSSLEDIAPQHLYSTETQPDVFKATRVWFSKNFTAAGVSYRTVFLVTKGEECHACSAQIGAVTFRLKNGKEDDWVQSQPNIATIGSYGDVAPLKDAHAAYDSPARIDAQPYELGGDRLAILTSETDGGQGELDTVMNVLVHNENGWQAAGLFQTAGSRLDDCRKGALGEAEGAVDENHDPLCYEWSGRVEVQPGPDKGWPDIIVKSTGTYLDEKSDRLVKAADDRYHYDGHLYTRVGS